MNKKRKIKQIWRFWGDVLQAVRYNETRISILALGKDHEGRRTDDDASKQT